jgi:hypothetical protein
MSDGWWGRTEEGEQRLSFCRREGSQQAESHRQGKPAGNEVSTDFANGFGCLGLLLFNRFA